MTEEQNTVMADTVQVRRADEFVVILASVSPDELTGVDPSEPLTVLIGHHEPEMMDHLAESLKEAVRDAVRHNQRSDDAGTAE